MGTPWLRVVDATWERAKYAARIKAEGRLSFAECFCVGLAQEKGATLVTCDRGFEDLEREGKIAGLWLPLERRDCLSPSRVD